MKRVMKSALISEILPYANTTTYILNPKKISLIQLNNIRNAILFDITTVAIDAMRVEKNTTTWPDEMFLGILNFVLLESNLCRLDMDCCGKMCNSCSGELRLSARGPTMVTTDHIKTGEYSKGLVVKPGPYPLFILKRNEEVEFILYATVGSGKRHVKFKPATVVYVETINNRYHMTIESTGVLTPDEILKKALKLIKE